MKKILSILSLLFINFYVLGSAADLPTITEKTKGMEKREGYIKYYWDDAQGKVFIEIERFNDEFLYANYLAAGMGSNDIGLDRGQLDQSRVVYFEKIGPKILLIQPNYDYRAVSNNAAEVNSVKEAFAQSTLWGFTAIAVEGKNVLVDATDFFLRDAHGVSNTMQQQKQGSYKLDASRSAMYLARTKNFPDNSEFEATISFTGSDAGNFARSVIPSPEALTLRMHHSFIKLPDNKYKPRLFHPGSGYNLMSYMDYATAIDESVVKRFIYRHRLEKKEPSAAVSEAVKPIVYYLDNGTPEPLRSALLEGASWWNQAFEAAGFKNAFIVKVLPDGADPLDVRYNVIQWVHRSTRGWSYGNSVSDPRTGEIIKGHVSLGSLRVRQDFLIAEGLLAPYGAGKTATEEMKKMALNRIRQLAAHEVGHTIGLAHNYIASTNDRASVMDYPHPTVTLSEDGKISLENAYDLKIGPWDKVAINYGYRQFASDTEERSGLENILKEATSKNLIFITDVDARAIGGLHPGAHLWDNGKDALEGTNQILAVRRTALRNFSADNIKIGTPYSSLEDVLVPVYNMHRYQVEAVSKMIGGLNYTYTVKGETDLKPSIVAPDLQRKAMDILLKTLDAEELAIPDHIMALIPPRAFGYNPTRELFAKRTGLSFDPLSAVESSANFTLSFLFHPERAARLVEYSAKNSENLSLEEMIQKTVDQTWKNSREKGLRAEVQYVAEQQVLNHLIGLVLNTKSSERVKSIAAFELSQLKQWIEGKNNSVKVDSYKSHLAYALQKINRFYENPQDFKVNYGPELPPGAPIGSEFGCEGEF